MGQIITFYSYKGGTGRSMALTNIAVLLTEWGYKVLMIDWDLEAPGLEYFFKLCPHFKSIQEKKGIIDLLNEFEKKYSKVLRQATQANLINCISNIIRKRSGMTYQPHILHDEEDLIFHLEKIISEISLPNTSNKLYLLTAGERDENYFKKVRNLDIQSFYEQSNGGELIEYLRNEFKRKFDFIFIDSRTGITDIGGVCTIQLPDILVLFFIASDQSFNGIIKVAKKAYDVQKNWTIDRQGLASIPVASRFDFNSEYETAKYWINRFASQLNDIYGRWLPVQSNTSLEDLVQKQIDMLMNTKLPYIPYFSFDEKMPVFEEKHNPGGLKYAYENIAALIANNLEDADQLINDRDTYIRKAAERPQATSKGGDLIMDNPSPSMPADEYIESEGFRLFLDETIRQNACNAVELFLKDNKPIKNAQLNAIPPAIQARGFSGLKDLIENQKGKDTKPENKAFWEFLNNIILAQPGSEFSLRQIIQNELKAHNLLTEETMSHDKIEQKKIRKANKAIVDEVLNHSIAIYFEHFNSHYFYITKQGAVS